MNLDQLDKIASEIKNSYTNRDRDRRNAYLVECLTKSKGQNGKIPIEDCIVDGLNAAIDIAISQSITITLKTLIKLGVIHLDER